MFIMILFWPITLPLFLGYLLLISQLFKKQLYFALAVVALSPFFAYETFQYLWFSKVLPAQIGITYPISISEKGGFREGCGAAVFKVSDETLDKIKKDGLKFFAGATQGRGHSNEHYYNYEEWKETPVPPSWTSEGSWILCSNLSHETHRKIVEAAKKKGAYYTSKHEAQLILIPSLGYVLFSFFG